MSNESKGIQDVTLYICLFHPQRKVIIVLCHIAELQKTMPEFITPALIVLNVIV